MKTFSVSALCLCVVAQPAFAKLTPEILWRDWQAAAQSIGATLVADAKPGEGGALTLENVNLRYSLPLEFGFDGEYIDIDIASLSLAPADEAAIAVTLGGEIIATTDKIRHPPTPYPFRLTLSHQDFVLNIRETEAGLAYAYRAARIDAVFKGSIIDQSGSGGLNFEYEGSASAEELEGGQTPSLEGENLRETYRFAAARSSSRIGMKDDGGFIDTLQEASAEAGAATFALTYPKTVSLLAIADPYILLTALQEGLAVSIASDQARSTSSSVSRTAGFELRNASEVGRAALAAEFDYEGAALALNFEDLAFTYAMPFLPVPEIAATLALGELAYTLPLGDSAEPREISMVTRLSGLTVNDELWDAFDPARKLPRDPAEIAVDVGGTISWQPWSIFYGMDAGGAAMPLLAFDLSANELRANAAGLALAGTGGFVFDLGDTPPGRMPPPPEGALDLTLAGLWRFLDTLVEIGALSEQDATGAHLVVELFARPGEGEDTLVTKIEYDEQGRITANGAPLE